MSEQYYTDPEVAKLLSISLSRLRTKICRGNPLPPSIKVPGSRTRLWEKNDVHNWLDQFKQDASNDIVKKSRLPRIRRAKK